MIEIFYKHRMEGPAMFELGMLVATTRIADRIREDKEFNHFVFDSLERYKNCDWGDLDEEDKMMNGEALKCGDRASRRLQKRGERLENLDHHRGGSQNHDYPFSGGVLR